MVRVHCVQLFYNLSDSGMEDLFYETEPVRLYAGLKLSSPYPSRPLSPTFRHSLEKHNLGLQVA